MQKASANFIKQLKKQKKEDSSLLFLDNKKIIKDAIKAGHLPKIALTSDSNFKFEGIDEDKIFLADNQTIDFLSDVKTPQGVCVMLEYTQHTAIKPNCNFLVLDGLQDPGNVGTLIRTAKASGFEYVYLINSVKETNSKMIRSSAGASFSLNLFSLTREEFIAKAKEWNLNLLRADMNGENIFKLTPKGVVGVVIGNEGQGVSKEISEICAKSIKIPMQAGIESLNAGVSGAIIMYQINKDKF